MKALFFILWVTALVGLDITSKAIFTKPFSLGIFSIAPILNRGSSFSMFSSFLFYNTVVLFLIFCVFSVCCVALIKKKYLLSHPKYFYFFLFFISGVLGNGIDRLFFGGVRDFLSIPFFAVINLADIYLTSSVIVLLYFYISEDKHLKESSN